MLELNLKDMRKIWVIHSSSQPSAQICACLFLTLSPNFPVFKLWCLPLLWYFQLNQLIWRWTGSKLFTLWIAFSKVIFFIQQKNCLSDRVSLRFQLFYSNSLDKKLKPFEIKASLFAIKVTFWESEWLRTPTPFLLNWKRTPLFEDYQWHFMTSSLFLDPILVCPGPPLNIDITGLTCSRGGNSLIRAAWYAVQKIELEIN